MNNIMKNNLKILSIFLIILYIILIIKLINLNKIEKFTEFITFFKLLSTPKKNVFIEKSLNKEENIKKKIKYIFIKYISKDRVGFYNKNLNKYIEVYINNSNYKKNIIIKDLDSKVIGEIINQIYNKIIFKLSIYKDYINIEYFNNFKSVKIYLDNDDKIFTIESNNNKNNVYIIKLFTLNIGKIRNNNNIYKIMVYEEYKLYLNLFGLGMIVLLHNY